jgi:membrane protein YdbS with pleckstrin-like domain
MHTNWFLIPFGIVFAGIGVMNLVNPRLSFRINQWQYKNKKALEPSDGALVLARVTGAVAAIVGIALVVTGIVSVVG